MRRDDTTRAVVVVGVALLTLLATLPVGALGTAGSGPAAGTGHADSYNYTVNPVDDPESAQNTDPGETCRQDAPGEDEGATGPSNCDPYDGHMPGDENASYAQFSAAGDLGKENITEVHWIVHADTSGDFDMSGCATNDAAVAGIDRGNDDPGYQTDEPLLTHAKNTYERENVILLEMYREGALAGEPLTLYTDDQIVARVEDCYTNPSEPGWYQWRGFANGTTADGDPGYIELYSHYFYICECTSRQEAVEKLGQPPSSSPQASSGDGGAPPEGGGGTPTPGETPTPTTSDPGTSTPTATDGTSPTATPGGSPDGTATPTVTGTSQQRQGPSTPTTTPGTTTGGTSTATAGTATTTGNATTGGPDGPTTPADGTTSGTSTPGGQPGFGLPMALGGLVAAALLATRRG